MSKWLKERTFVYEVSSHLKHYQAPKNLNFGISLGLWLCWYSQIVFIWDLVIDVLCSDC